MKVTIRRLNRGLYAGYWLVHVAFARGSTGTASEITGSYCSAIRSADKWIRIETERWVSERFIKTAEFDRQVAVLLGGAR